MFSEFKSKQSTSSFSIQTELESGREYLNSAEERLKRIEAENVNLAQRVMDEKRKALNAMNEVNRLMEAQASGSGGGIMGGFSLMKKIGGATGLFPVAKSSHAVGEEGVDDLEDDFVDLKSDGGNDDKDLPIIYDVCPPRQSLVTAVCHNGEVNDIVSNRHFFMTASSDSTVKIFDRKIVGSADSDTSYERTSGIQMGHIDARHTLTCGGPALSLHLTGEWLAAGCSDNIARVWNVKTGRLRHNLSGHSNKVTSVRLVGESSGRIYALQCITMCMAAV